MPGVTERTMEIERKFLIGALPEDLGSYDSCPIVQAYVSRRPAVRIRQTGDRYILTVKGPGRLSHEEFELPLDREAYEHLMKKHDGKLIVKRRYRIPYGAHTIELDVFEEPLKLCMAEVEFGSEEEALAFEGPDWFGEEVTYDKRYSNAYMAYES